MPQHDPDTPPASGGCVRLRVRAATCRLLPLGASLRSIVGVSVSAQRWPRALPFALTGRARFVAWHGETPVASLTPLQTAFREARGRPILQVSLEHRPRDPHRARAEVSAVFCVETVCGAPPSLRFSLHSLPGEENDFGRHPTSRLLSPCQRLASALHSFGHRALWFQRMQFRVHEDPPT